MAANLRIELKFKNAILFNAIARSYPTTEPRQKCGDIKALANKIDVPYSSIMSLLNLTQSPWLREGLPRSIAIKLSNELGIPCEELFPMSLYSGVIPKRLAAEVDADRYISLSEARAQKLLPSSTEDTEEQFDAENAHETIERSISTLAPRKQKLIEMRFGLDGSGEHTLVEVAEAFGITQERARQIEAQALRDLRHPCRSRNLRGLL